MKLRRVPILGSKRKSGGSRKSLRANLTSEWPYTRALLLPAALLAMLMVTTMALTTPRSSSDLLALALHFPLFMVIAVIGTASVAPRRRGLLYLAIPVVLVEWILWLILLRIQ